MAKYPLVYQLHEYGPPLLDDPVFCLACTLFFIGVTALALTLVIYRLLHLYKSRRLQDCSKAEEKVVVASKPQNFLNKNESLQNSVNDIERWMTSAGINQLLTLSSPEDLSSMSEAEICTVILLELITCDRTRTLQLIIDSLHNNFNDILANAFAHLITVALNLSPNTVLPIKKLLAVSPDSFVFDYIYIVLIHENGVNKKAIMPRISVPKGIDDLDQYNTFLYSSTPSVGKFGLFVSSIPVVNRLFTPCKMMDSDDLILQLLDYAVSARIEREAARVCDEIESLQSSLQLSDKNKDTIDSTKTITAETIYDNVVETHYYVLSSLKEQIVDFLQEIQLFDDIQKDYFVASSPLVSVHIIRVKKAYKSMINRYKQLEHSLLQWERAYVVSQICTGDIFFSFKDIQSQLSKIPATKDCSVITHELNELTEMIKKNEERAFCLYTAFFKNDNLLDEGMKELCKENILKALVCYRDISKSNQMFNELSKTVLDILQSVQRGLFEVGHIHLDDTHYVQENYDRVESTLRHIQNDIFAFAYDKFITFSGKIGPTKLKDMPLQEEDNSNVQRDIMLLFYETFVEIFDHVEMKLTELKKALAKCNNALTNLK